MSNRLEEIKDEYAVEQGFVDFNEMYLTFGLPISEKAMDVVSQRYARECCIATQKQIVNNFNTDKCYEGGQYCATEGHENDITNPDNIILL